MSDKSSVSVIITTYKREPQKVKRAVMSVMNQSYKNLEIIVVDDSPSDYELRDEVKQYIIDLDDKIKYIQHEKNLGACAARNTGIKNSTGEFVAFLDDDDEWLSKKLEKQMKKFKSNDVGLVYCGQYVINEESKQKKNIKRHFFKGSVYDELLYGNFVGSTSFAVLRREAIEKIGGFDEKLKSAQDYDLWLRIAKISEIDYIDEPLVNYYVHKGERISGNPKNKIQGLEEINIKNKDYIQRDKGILWKRKMVLAPMYAWDRQYERAFKQWIECVKIKPLYVCGNLKFLKDILVYTKLSRK